MSRKRKRKAQSKYRWGFVLDTDSPRDAMVQDHLSDLAIDDMASEYIREAIYMRMRMDQHAPDLGAEPTLFDVAAQIEDLKRKLESMQFVGDRPASVPELDDEREKRLSGKLLGMKFTQEERP